MAFIWLLAIGFILLIADSKNVVSFIKRKMGDREFRRKIYGHEYIPQALSAMILTKLKKDAEKYFMNQGREVEIKDAVITVPAYFGMEQKGVTKEAGELAGLNVLMIINEPSAAALAYGINKMGENQTVFVFDLGGGTFDVTILEIMGNDIRMLASDDNPELGGKDWDDAIVDYASKLFKDKYGEDPQDDLISYQDLYERALNAKITLSSKPKALIPVNHAGKRENIGLSREKFEEISRDLLTQCESRSQQVLEKAKKSWSDMDVILLVGGATYMPMVRNMIKRISGKEPSSAINPDHCVAIGAAFQAKYRYIEERIRDIEEQIGEKEAEKERKRLLGRLPDIRIKESVAKTLGIVILDDNEKKIVLEMIPEQTEIPFEKEGEFAYAYDNMTAVKVQVTEGKGTIDEKRVGVIGTPDEVSIVGEIILDGLPPRPKRTPIEVIYKYNRDKTLDVEVIDVQTRKKETGKVVLGGSLTEEERIREKEHLSQMKYS